MSLVPKLNVVWRVPLILVWTAAMATISLFISLFDGTGRLQHACARTWSRVILQVTRARVEITGLERLDTSKAYVFASNHLSMFDIWVFLAHLPFQFRFVAKVSLFKWPFLGWHLRRAGNIPIDRRNPRKAIESYEAAGAKIRAGVSVVVFPEGMRTWGDTVAPFKRGSFVLAQKAQVPIVPVTIIGSHRLLPRGSFLVQPGDIEVKIHAPLEYDHYKHLELESLAESVRKTILNSYHQVS